MPVITFDSDDFADSPASKLALDMDDEMDHFSDLGLNVFNGCLLMASHCQISEAAQRFGGRVGMDRSKRP